MLAGLQALDLSSCAKVTGVGFYGFGSASSLSSLCLANCSALVDTGLQSLAASLGRLALLDLSGCVQAGGYGAWYPSSKASTWTCALQRRD